MNNKEKVLQVTGLSKSFGGVQAVDDVSFELRKGELLGIIGPNGSGKTTLVNLITGFVKKNKGEVLLGGKNISRWPAYKIADAGLVRTFQVVRPLTSMPAYKNIIPPLTSPRYRRTVHGKLGDKDAVAIDILEEVGFERDAYVPYKITGTLPLGYLKRLELARCLALQPEIILSDEIFSGLSYTEISSMIPLIERLRMKGITLVMIEHRIRELFQVADRVLVMNFGKKLADGLPKDVMNLDSVRTAYLGKEKKSS
ncbi:MAG: ABC transporter ATP-binding protein [Pseudomonadota bacterium]